MVAHAVRPLHVRPQGFGKESPIQMNFIALTASGMACTSFSYLACNSVSMLF